MNILTFLPLTERVKASKGKRTFLSMPLFPSYVFIYLKDRQDYFTGMGIDGALWYVRTGKDIARVSGNVIQNIRLLTQQGLGLEVSESRFARGQSVEIKKGPLTGLACEVVRIDNKEKILVRVDLMRRNLLVTVPTEYLI